MPKLRHLIRGVLGLSRSSTLDGRPLPQSVQGLKAVVVCHDRRLSAGIFALRKKRRKATSLYRVVMWRTYRDRKTRKERATTVFHRDELDPVLRLLAQCGERLDRGE